MEKNPLLMQYFEWYLPNDGRHWQRLLEDVDHLSHLGVDNLWLPPVCKATSTNDVGYGIYDLWDLGEFDQNGAIRTKYGDKEGLLRAIQAIKAAGIRPIADLVLNHKANADGKERFQVLKMDPNQRNHPLSDPYEIEGWTHFYFPNRSQKYDDFEWHWYHFSGLDYDALNEESGLYLILGDQKGWANNERVANEYGNYDYLMFNDVDYRHPEVVDQTKKWVRWFIEETGFEGLRLDAIKHIDASFMKEFIGEIQQEKGEDFYIFGEYWNADAQETRHYLEQLDYEFDLFDVALHMNFYQASKLNNTYDMRQIFQGTLVADHPLLAVTFVNNHDTQMNQALESQVEDWFIPLAYALILLRQGGLPTLFYGDYYGQGEGGHPTSFKDQLDPLLHLRLHHAYGEQIDYFDHENTIGWTRLGSDEHPDGLAVVLTNGDAGYKEMSMGVLNAGKVFVDYLGNHEGQVQLDDAGNGKFLVKPGSVSVWINQEAL